MLYNKWGLRLDIHSYNDFYCHKVLWDKEHFLNKPSPTYLIPFKHSSMCLYVRTQMYIHYCVFLVGLSIQITRIRLPCDITANNVNLLYFIFKRFLFAWYTTQ